jgi:hypothetical protein
MDLIRGGQPVQIDPDPDQQRGADDRKDPLQQQVVAHPQDDQRAR